MIGQARHVGPVSGGVGMTEDEWLTGAYPGPMVCHVAGRTSPRKLRLLFAALFDRVSDHYDVVHRPEDTLAELADGPIGRRELAVRLVAFRAAVAVGHDSSWLTRAFRQTAGMAVARDPTVMAGHVLDRLIRLETNWAIVGPPGLPAHEHEAAQRRAEQSAAAILRDVFGNPFRAVTFDPRWRTADTVGVVTAIYEGRAFERLPILADALMDAGCDSEEILAHCRTDGPHVRGCWVVDLVLGFP